jgi:hypothetical protein
VPFFDASFWTVHNVAIEAVPVLASLGREQQQPFKHLCIVNVADLVVVNLEHAGHRCSCKGLLQVQQNPGSGNGWTHKSVFQAVKIVLLCPMVCSPCLQRSRIGAGVAMLLENLSFQQFDRPFLPTQLSKDLKVLLVKGVEEEGPSVFLL